MSTVYYNHFSQIFLTIVQDKVNGCKLAIITIFVTTVVGLCLVLALFNYNPECEVFIRNTISDLKAKMTSVINKLDIFFHNTPEINDEINLESVKDDSTNLRLTTTPNSK